MMEPECLVRNQNFICLPQIHSLKNIRKELASENVDVRLYLPFDFVRISSKIAGPGDIAPRLNNITFSFSPSPLLSQIRDVKGLDVICNSDYKPGSCTEDHLCECVHVIDIPFDANVELILIDQSQVDLQKEYVFHLHGYSFYVVGVTHDLRDVSIDQIKSLDDQGQIFHRNLKNPVLKDTVAVPKGGAVAIRFRAENAGYWLLHEQSPSNWASGLSTVLRVGEKGDLPSLPDDFPLCGSWVGPEFFLI